MNMTQETSKEIRELTENELTAVAGGYVQCSETSKTVTITRTCNASGACSTTTVTVKHYTC